MSMLCLNLKKSKAFFFFLLLFEVWKIREVVCTVLSTLSIPFVPSS